MPPAQPISQQTILPKLILEPNSLKCWTREEYNRISELGLLNPDERTELIAGQIILMAAKGTKHVAALQLLAETLRNQLDNTVFVRTQDPIQLDDFSEPEPDLTIVKGSVLDYTERHPHPEEVDLVVEVADSTLNNDCEIKDKLYALANINEYWVLDVNNRQLHIFRHPAATGYTSHLILSEPNQVSLLSFPRVTVTLSLILPPC
jgi:Uma2 family endonuclease